MRIPECIIKIKIAADDITKLRKVDVFRVLDSCNVYERKAVSEYITSNRPGSRGRGSRLSERHCRRADRSQGKCIARKW
ncbi:hypothetical protein BDD14_6548 [Edaphobacter modestus]|uniref:Uncharacterized protein n=1 Tax=Edaphobacter modestus TaxID=388466 RepID=A0A4Q7XX65_9BACT|nr:hypothetical protein BDD14_6548 [Edaphobacter modestus]